MAYQAASGYNNAGGLVTLTHQPKCAGIRDGRRVVRGDGLVIADGLGNAELLFTALKKSQYETVLQELFVDSAVSAEITITLPSNTDRTFSNYNAIVTRPDMPSDGGFEFAYRDMVFRLTGIQAI